MLKTEHIPEELFLKWLQVRKRTELIVLSQLFKIKNDMAAEYLSEHCVSQILFIPVILVLEIAVAKPYQKSHLWSEIHHQVINRGTVFPRSQEDYSVLSF